MTDQNKFECKTNFDDTTNLLPYEENVEKQNDSIKSTVYKNEEISTLSTDEIKDDERKKYKDLIKGHPLFSVLLLQFKLCEKAMYNVSNIRPISMEPMSNVSFYIE